MTQKIEENGGIPPLEDMSGVLEKLGFYDPKAGCSGSSSSQMTLNAQDGKTSVPCPSSQQADSTGCSSNPSSKKSSLELSKPVPQKAKKSPHASSGAMFGGMKKGFLLSSKTSSTKTSTATSKQSSRDCLKAPSSEGSSSSTQSGGSTSEHDDIPFLRGQTSHDSKDSLVFPEVQEALKSSQSLLDNKDWITADLLKRVQSNPTLAKHMADPDFMKVLEEFHANPTVAMQKYASNPEMSTFLKEFCDLMGSHFTQLADKEEQGDGVKPRQQERLLTERTKTSGARHSDHDDKEVQALLQDPDVQKALLDPSMQKFLLDLKTNPEKAQSYVHQAPPEMKKMISLFVSKGLLGVQR